MPKRTLDTFFAPPSKKQKPETTDRCVSPHRSDHATYPWPVPHLPPHISEEIEQLVTKEGKVINDQPHLDLLYFAPYIPRVIQNDFFDFLRAELFFYRVQYTVKRAGKEIVVNTPRYTTVFGLDESSRFADHGASIVDASDLSKQVRKYKYKCKPRPVPECLDLLRRVTEASTDTKYNFCLVNYYASGSDSISYHSDDEHFLGAEPAIASFSLGARRDFLLKHKVPATGKPELEANNLKLSLASGDMILMRGRTQSNWLHSIPKRRGGDADQGRINITLRRAMIPAGTENYYRYNVGDGVPYKWNKDRNEMLPWSNSA